MVWPRIAGVRSNGSCRRFTIVGMSVVIFSPGQPYGCWMKLVLKVVDPHSAEVRSTEVEDLVTLGRPFTGE